MLQNTTKPKNRCTFHFRGSSAATAFAAGMISHVLRDKYVLTFLAHLSRRLMGELIVYRSSRRPSVRPSVCPSTLSNMYISKTSRPNATKFYLKHHWGERKAASGFGPDRIRTLVSMATDSSYRVIMGKTAFSRFRKGC